MKLTALALCGSFALYAAGCGASAQVSPPSSTAADKFPNGSDLCLAVSDEWDSANPEMTVQHYEGAVKPKFENDRSRWNCRFGVIYNELGLVNVTVDVSVDQKAGTFTYEPRLIDAFDCQKTDTQLAAASTRDCPLY